MAIAPGVLAPLMVARQPEQIGHLLSGHVQLVLERREIPCAGRCVLDQHGSMRAASAREKRVSWSFPFGMSGCAACATAARECRPNGSNNQELFTAVFGRLCIDGKWMKGVTRWLTCGRRRLWVSGKHVRSVSVIGRRTAQLGIRSLQGIFQARPDAQICWSQDVEDWLSGGSLMILPLSSRRAGIR